MKITLKRLNDAVHFEAANESGNTIQMDGSPAIGGEGKGARPMEVLLMSLAGCTSMDVVSMLQKMREPLDGFAVEVEGERREQIPQIFVKIHIKFFFSGNIDKEKAKRAVDLSAEKYCSVSKMLEPSAVLTHEIIYQ
jgi:putative redox protein